MQLLQFCCWSLISRENRLFWVYTCICVMPNQREISMKTFRKSSPLLVTMETPLLSLWPLHAEGNEVVIRFNDQDYKGVVKYSKHQPAHSCHWLNLQTRQIFQIPSRLRMYASRDVSLATHTLCTVSRAGAGGVNDSPAGVKYPLCLLHSVEKETKMTPFEVMYVM